MDSTLKDTGDQSTGGGRSLEQIGPLAKFIFRVPRSDQEHQTWMVSGGIRQGDVLM